MAKTRMSQGNLPTSGRKRRLRLSLQTVALYRIIRIVSLAVRFFLQVYRYQRRHPQPWSDREFAAWEALVARQAAEYRQVALRLEGLLIKLGQFLSTRADIMPKAFLRELEHLVDQVPAVPWEGVEAILHAEWGGEYQTVLREISAEPVASASIGVVYRGILQSGEEVAVKVRRPGIERIIRADFRAVRIVLWLARRFTKLGKRANLPALYREMTAVIGDELNFVKELQNGEYFRKRYEDFPGVEVPAFYRAWSTRKVLVMEWMEGARISDLDYLKNNGLDRQEMAARLFRCFTEQLFQAGKFHADPHPGNILVKADGSIVLIDFGMIGVIRSDDAVLIRDLIEGVVFLDAGKIVASLERLRFLLPTADKPALERVVLSLISLYTQEGMKRFDERVLDQILNDIQDTIHRQPIQLPSEFAFLGRALSTFVGVLHILDPGVDLAALGKPIVKEWLASQGEQASGRGSADFSARGEQTKSGQAGKGGKKGMAAGLGEAFSAAMGNATWLRLLREYGTPVLRYPRLLEAALETPVQRLQWDREQARVARRQHYYQVQQAYAFTSMLLAAALLCAGIWLRLQAYQIIGGGGLILAVLWFAVLAFGQSRWLDEQGSRD